MTRGELISDGCEKQIFATDDPGQVILRFKDVATAFNNVKTALFPRKGIVNNEISGILMGYLSDCGIYTHFIKSIGEREQLCRRCSVIPLELVVRNYIAGSLADRLALEEGTKPATVIYDLNYKDSALGDPMINDSQAVALGIVRKEELSGIYSMACTANECLSSLLSRAGIRLVDFKLEFGRDSAGRLMLTDEISPDTCRLWDEATGQRLDKDRFRHDLGNIVPSYEEVLNRLISINK
jgi:phosphoribosylaminoimidazole-succinocarboxamide synthase